MRQLGSNTIPKPNVLRGSDPLLLAEGVNVFPAQIPESMAGRQLRELHVRSQTGCTIIAVESGGEKGVNPPAAYTLPASERICLIGTIEAKDQFLKRFRPPLWVSKKRRDFAQ